MTRSTTRTRVRLRRALAKGPSAALVGAGVLQTLTNIGIPAIPLKEVCWRASQFPEAQRLARLFRKLDKAVRAMQRLLKLRDDLARDGEELDPVMPIRSFATSLNRESRVQALIELATVAHGEVVDCVNSLIAPLPDGVVQQLDGVSQILIDQRAHALLHVGKTEGLNGGWSSLMRTALGPQFP